MYITVKYGNNESLLCNPSCAIANLLSSIKRRTGYGNTAVSLDLSDESGLVKELDAHRLDYATKHLNSHDTYILVEKQTQASDDGDSGSPSPPQYTYVPLLDNYTELFPDYRLHVLHTVEKRRGRPKQYTKSPSPAGVRGTKGLKGKAQQPRAPSRKK